MGANRRRQRSVAMSVAVGLLALATVVVGWCIGTGWMLGAAAVVALGGGLVAARIISNELAQARRDAARDRAQQAIAYHQLATRKAVEHARFLAVLTHRLSAQELVVGQLRRALRAALRRADASAQRARAESRRAGELAAEVAALRAELNRAERAERAEREDELAMWDGSDARSVVDLLGWDQRAAAATPADARRQA